MTRSLVPLCLLAVPWLVRGQTCPPPVIGNPDGNYVVPGSLGDIAYKPGLALDAYVPEGPPRPGAFVIRGSHGNRRGYVEALKKQGVAAVFQPGASLDAIVSFIRAAVPA